MVLLNCAAIQLLIRFIILEQPDNTENYHNDSVMSSLITLLGLSLSWNKLFVVTLQFDVIMKIIAVYTNGALEV